MKLSQDQANAIAYHVVLHWLSGPTHLDPDDVDVMKDFNYYHLTEGAYLDMCNDVTKSINKTCGLAMTLTGQWRLDHRDDAIATFVFELARVMQKAPPSSTAKAADAHIANAAKAGK